MLSPCQRACRARPARSRSTSPPPAGAGRWAPGRARGRRAARRWRVPITSPARISRSPARDLLAGAPDVLALGRGLVDQDLAVRLLGPLERHHRRAAGRDRGPGHDPDGGAGGERRRSWSGRRRSRRRPAGAPAARRWRRRRRGRPRRSRPCRSCRRPAATPAACTSSATGRPSASISGWSKGAIGSMRREHPGEVVLDGQGPVGGGGLGAGHGPTLIGGRATRRAWPRRGLRPHRRVRARPRASRCPSR